MVSVEASNLHVEAKIHPQRIWISVINFLFPRGFIVSGLNKGLIRSIYELIIIVNGIPSRKSKETFRKKKTGCYLGKRA